MLEEQQRTLESISSRLKTLEAGSSRE